MKKSALLISMAVLTLSGCATKTQRVVDTAKVNDPKIILKSTGMPMDVKYSVNSSEVACENFETVGTVRDSGRGVLLPWIAKLSEKINKVPTQLEKIVPANTQIQVMGYGKWYDGISRGSCGPLVTKFTPNESTTYLVEFVWEGTARCSSRVFEVTNQLEKKLVPAQLDSCPRSFISVLLD